MGKMFDMDMLLKRSAKPSFPGPNPGGTSRSNSNLCKWVAVFLCTATREFTLLNNCVCMFMRIFCMLREPRGENGGNQKFNNCQMLKSDAPRGKI